MIRYKYKYYTIAPEESSKTLKGVVPDSWKKHSLSCWSWFCYTFGRANTDSHFFEILAFTHTIFVFNWLFCFVF